MRRLSKMENITEIEKNASGYPNECIGQKKVERFWEVFELFINVKPTLGFIIDVGLYRVLFLHLRQFCIGMCT